MADRKVIVLTGSDGNDYDIRDEELHQGIGSIPSGQTVEGQISALESGKVPTTRKVNNKDLSSDITLFGTDIPVSSSDNTKVDSALANKVPNTRKVNSKALSSDVNLVGSDIPVSALDNTKLDDAITGLKSALFADGLSWIKELYINPAGKTAGIASVRDVRVASSQIALRFDDSNASAIALTEYYALTSKPYGITPIYLKKSSGSPNTDVLYGYCVIDLTEFSASKTLNAVISEKAYHLEFSPTIKQFLSGVTYTEQTLTDSEKDQARDNIGAISDDDMADYVGHPKLTPVTSSSDFTNTSQSVKHGGDAGTYEGYNTTDFISCEPGEVIDFKLLGYYRQSVDLILDTIAYFDESKQYVDGIYYTAGTSGAGAVYIGQTTVPNGVKYFKALTNDSVVTNPYVNILPTGLFGNASQRVQAKVACIGDSLTQGLTGSDPYTFAEKPWPSVFRDYLLNRGFDITVKNYGRKGLSPKTYWETAIPVDGAHHSPNTGEPGDTIEFDSSFDAVFIMLGTNGHLEEGGSSQQLQIDDYCNIIEYVMTNTQNHAQIILIAPIYANAEGYEEKLIGTLPTIKALGEKYQIPVINALYESGLGKYNKTVFYNTTDNLHLNQAGYSKLGTFIASKFTSLYSTFNMNEIPT